MDDGYVHILDTKIQNIWEDLGRMGNRYLLTGGTAIAWHLGHRASYDIDITTSKELEHPRVIRRKINNASLGKHKWIRRSPDHYIKFFATEETPKIDIHGKVPSGCLDFPIMARNGLRIASLTDLLKQKLVAMCARSEERDGEDVSAILSDGRANIHMAISALRDETGTGIGVNDAEHLAERLLDLRTTPWSKFENLSELPAILVSERLPPLKMVGPNDETTEAQQLESKHKDSHALER